jgi:hypothetical protein
MTVKELAIQFTYPILRGNDDELCEKVRRIDML